MWLKQAMVPKADPNSHTELLLNPRQIEESRWCLVFPKYPEFAAPSFFPYPWDTISGSEFIRKAKPGRSFPTIFAFIVHFTTSFLLITTPPLHKGFDSFITSTFPPKCKCFTCLNLTCTAQELGSNFCIHPWGYLMEQILQEYLMPFFRLLNFISMNLYILTSHFLRAGDHFPPVWCWLISFSPCTASM